MRKMTCRNGLVWQGRRARFVFVAAMCLGLIVTSARGGDLNPPAGPDSTNSAMWTLNDIYNVLDTHTTNVTKRAAFAEPSGGPTNGTMHTLNDIMTLVTNRAPAPVSKTGQTPTIPYATLPGSDGNLQIGVVWPNPRFTVQTNTNCVLDNLTGLIWARNANLPGGTRDWTNAISFCTNMNSGAGTYGYTDWRLPTVRELHSLIAWQYNGPALSDGTGTNQWTEALGPFTGVQLPNADNSAYWASSAYADGTDCAWTVNLWAAYVYWSTKVTAWYVWPVRGGR